MADTNKMIGSFAGKPKTERLFQFINEYVRSLGEVDQTIKAQASYSVNRKFLWLWAYEKTPDGTLYVTIQLDKPWEDPNFHYVKQVSAHRWNHHVVLKSEETAKSEWLKSFIAKGYAFSQN